MAEVGARRIPKQARSKKRYDAIIETATKLFSENGFTTTSTNEIAAAAGISIGSLYQYFDNKEAIIMGVSEQYVDGFREITSDFLTSSINALSAEAIVDSLFDPIIAFHSARPGFSRLWLGADFSEALRMGVMAMNNEILSRLETLIHERVPSLRRDQRMVVAVVIQSAVKSLLGLFRQSDNAKFKKQLATEAKKMLTRYIEGLIADNPSLKDSQATQ